MSVAPEIARLAEAVLLAHVPSAVSDEGSGPVLTLGALAGHLRVLAATPERWWGLVRFDPGRAVKIPVEDHPGYHAWLVVLPPGDDSQSNAQDCDCDVVTMIAGEATEGAPSSAILRPGTLRVHGQRHWLRGQGTGYSISLHARARHPAIPTAGNAGVIG
jgi:hypothetical protein